MLPATTSRQPPEPSAADRQLALNILRALWHKRQAAEVLADYNINTVALERLFDEVPGFQSAYKRALWDKAWRGRKVTFRLFDGIYPAWRELLLQNLEEQAETGKRPKLSVAVRALNEMEIPVKVGWVYHLCQPSSRYYNEEFAMAVQTAVSETTQKIREILEDDLTDPDRPELSGTRLSYLKAQRHSGFGESSHVRVEQTSQHEERTTIAVELIQESHQIGEQLKRRLIDVTDTGANGSKGKGKGRGHSEGPGGSRSRSRKKKAEGRSAYEEAVAQARQHRRKAAREKAAQQGA